MLSKFAVRVTFIEDQPEAGDSNKVSSELNPSFDECSDGIATPKSLFLTDRSDPRRASLAQLDLLESRIRDDSYSFLSDSWDLKTPAGTLDKFWGAIREWLTAYHVYGFDLSQVPIDHLFRSVKARIDDCYRVMETGVEWYAYFKYFNAAFYSYKMSELCDPQEMPTEPSWFSLCKIRDFKSLFGGKFYKWERAMAYAKPLLYMEFVLTILMSKKGMPRPCNDSVIRSQLKTAKALTEFQPDTYDSDAHEIHVCIRPDAFRNMSVVTKDRDSLLESDNGETYWYTNKVFEVTHDDGKVEEFPEALAYVSQGFIKKQLDRTVREIVKSAPSLRELTRPFLPSGGACCTHTREEMGSYGALNDIDDLFSSSFRKGWALDDNGFIFESRDPNFSLECRSRMVKLRGYISEYYGSKGSFDQFVGEIDSECYSVLGCEIDAEEFLKRFRSFYWKCVKFALVHESDAKVSLVGLSEALKVRIISKGPPVTYFVLKPLQKFLWKQLQSFSLFELTGTPVTEALVNKKYGRAAYDSRSVWRYHSGDMESATDKMKSWVSEEICNSIFNVFEESSGFSWKAHRLLFLRALTRHTLRYRDGTTWIEAKQTIGQLMGSIVSFPILCIGNAAASRLSLEIAEQRKVALRDFPGWINGDDVVTRYRHEVNFDRVWTEVMQIFGFNKSIGKCYDSYRFFNVNSTTFRLTSTGNFRLVRYANLGLVHGLKRSTELKSGLHVETDPFQLAMQYNELMSLCTPSTKGRLHELFFKSQFTRLRDVSTVNGVHIPWFIPTQFGGLGFQGIEPASRYDRQIAARCREILADRPDLQPTYTGAKDWVHFDKYQSFIRSNAPWVCNYSYREMDLLPDWEEDSGMVAVAYTSWVKDGIDSLYSPRESESQNTLRKCVRLISKATASLGNISPLDSNFEIETKKSVSPVVLVGVY